MAETIYTVGVPGEMPEIIDFINYVFSQAKRPHDFKTLLPKVYGDNAPEGQEQFHFLAKQEGKIVGCVACRPTVLRFGDATLRCGYIGSVSVHKYHRGEGHMKKLMAMALEDAHAKGYDMLILGGQRQRYGYFGFEPAGTVLNFYFTKTNARHVFQQSRKNRLCIRPMTEEDASCANTLWQKQIVSSPRETRTFLNDLSSWEQTPVCFIAGEEFAGYMAGSELILREESLLPEALEALMQQRSEYDLRLTAGLHEKQRIAYLSRVCESVHLGSKAMISVLNWPRVLAALLEFKHRYVCPVADGAFSLAIEGDGNFSVKVENGCAEIVKLAAVPQDAAELSHNEAQRLFFGIADTVLDSKGIHRSCLGLPFTMSDQDGF